MANQFTVRIEDSFDEDVFEALFESSKSYIRQNLNLDESNISDYEAKNMMRHTFQNGMDYYYGEKEKVIISVSEGDHVLAYYLAFVDKDNDQLIIHFMLSNTDKKGSRSWIYRFYNTKGLQPVLKKLGVAGWSAATFGKNMEESLTHGAIKTKERRGDKEVVVFKSPYGWKSK